MLRTVTSTTYRIHPSFNCSSSFHSPWFVRHVSYSENGSRPDTSASSRLWADALKEEAEDPKTETRTSDRPSLQPSEHPNWTGDESVQDAVLRMLVDKYKPLRGGSIRTAEEKLKSTPLNLRSSDIPLSPASSEDILPEVPTPPQDDASTETHKPWLTTFRAPSHTTSVRYMRLPLLPPPATARNAPIHPDDTRSRIAEKERKKKAAYAGRLTNARESSLDYRIGKIATGASGQPVHRPNPVSVKGWASLVEERIERARNEGHFRSIKGRGKPIVPDNEQSNPFIAREEFLMNRIVQRQGAAPPWIEFQGELETAITSFRGVLQSSWTRRAVRSLTLERPPGLLPTLTLSDVTGPRMRDREWEAREAAYHEGALNEINALVRKYNGVAPYAVRRTYLTRETELERIYKISGEDILAEITKRRQAGPVDVEVGEEVDPGSSQGGSDGGRLKPIGFNLRAIWNRWVAKFVGG